MNDILKNKMSGLSANFPGWIIASCILFNFFLCFVHTNALFVSPVIIIICEMILVGISALYGFHRIDKAKLYWLSILACQFLLFVVLSLLKDEIPLKAFRDLLIVPVFVILGLSAARMDFTKFVLAICAFIAVIAIWEALNADRFLSIFNFKNFYLAKGTITDAEITLLNTFVSGERPGGRFLLDIPGVHRVSSVFLEPVSLGFFGFIITLYGMAVRENISRFAYFFLLFLGLFFIWISDARLAMGCFAMIFLLRGILRRIDHRFSVLVFPSIILTFFILTHYQFITSVGDNLGGRFAATMLFLKEIDVGTITGITGFEHFTADSAAGDLVNNMGILGLLLYWLPPIFFMKSVPPQARVYIFGVMLLTGMAYIISAAIFTIKTAAFVWFSYGYIIARTKWLEETDPETQSIL